MSWGISIGRGTGGGTGGGAGRGNGGARRPGGAPRRAVSTLGSSTRRRKAPPMPARSQRSAGLDAEEAEENVDDNSSKSDKELICLFENAYDKACWTKDSNIHVFCELALEQMALGNCPNLQLKSYAVKEIAQNFFDRTGLWLQHKQFRNRLSGCRTMYNWLKRHCRDTGDGRNARGGIEGHNEDWWKAECKGVNWECKKFRRGMPSYVGMLYDMFNGTQVDGSTSCIPGTDDGWTNQSGGGEEEVDAEEEEEEEEEDQETFSHQTPSRKRTSSTTDTATSPKTRKSKSPMVKCMDRIVNNMEAQTVNEVQVAKEIRQKIEELKNEQKLQQEQNRKDDMARCLDEVRACGIDEDSDEFYVASMMFTEDDHRFVFSQFKTTAGRIGWLKRSVRDWPRA